MRPVRVLSILRRVMGISFLEERAIDIDAFGDHDDQEQIDCYQHRHRLVFLCGMSFTRRLPS